MRIFSRGILVFVRRSSSSLGSVKLLRSSTTNNTRFSRYYCTTTTTTSLIDSKKVTVEIHNGLPYVTIPLPSRNELCVFVLKPITQNVGDFLQMLQTEDRGIDRAIVRRASNGIRISSTAPIRTLLESDFRLFINDKEYHVSPPKPEEESRFLAPPTDLDIKLFGDIRARVSQLFSVLHVGEYLAQEEERLLEELEGPKQELALLEPQFQILSQKAAKITDRYMYYFLAIPAFQFGFLARLTWFEYSWDIMEPITYFVTAFNAMLSLKYYIMTKQEYLVPNFEDRVYLISFHKQASQVDFDVERYNELCTIIAAKEKELRRFRELRTLGIIGSNH